MGSLLEIPSFSLATGPPRLRPVGGYRCQQALRSRFVPLELDGRPLGTCSVGTTLSRAGAVRHSRPCGYLAAPAAEGWFVLNGREARWLQGEGVSASCEFEGAKEFPQVGIFLRVPGPGEPIAMYHWEADQEDFLVLSGQALLIVEGEERPLRRWDFFHCPAGTKHIIVGAGDAPCVVLAVGAREHQADADWGGYAVDETALRHGAGVEEESTDPRQAYAQFPNREPGPYRQGWLPG